MAHCSSIRSYCILFGGFFITREGIKRGREKEKRRESARKEEGRECVKKKKREGKERERRKEIGIQVPARPSIDGPVIAWRAHACFFENVHLPLGCAGERTGAGAQRQQGGGGAAVALGLYPELAPCLPVDATASEFGSWRSVWCFGG